MLGVGGLRRVAAAVATRRRPLSTAGGQPAVALRDGTSMPAAICGTYVGNAEGHTSPEDCPALVAAALEVGFQHFDSALMYMNEAELGAALGASRVLNESEAEPGALAGVGAEAPIDLVLETVGGSADTLHAAAAALRPGGVVSVLGVFLGDVAVPAFPLLLKEGTLAWSNCYEHRADGSDFADAIALLTAHRDALAPLATASVALDEIARGLELAADKKSGAVKVTVRPQGS